MAPKRLILFDLCAPEAEDSHVKGKINRVPSNPVSIVLGKSRRQSQSKFLQLPVELLDEILVHIPSSALSSLARVSSFCCAIARCRQFQEVTLDYSPKSWLILARLEAEILQKTENNLAPALPSISNCIRLLRVATKPWCVEDRHVFSAGKLWSCSESEKDKQIDSIYDSYYSNYLGSITLLLKLGLPNIEHIQWLDRAPLPEGAFTALANSHAKHITLAHTSVDVDYAIEGQWQPELQIHTWPIQSLTFGVETPTCEDRAIWDISGPMTAKRHRVVGMNRARSSIFTLCAPTLERLSWVGYMRLERQTLTDGVGSNIPSFPKLQELRLVWVLHQDSSILRTLLGEPGNSSCQVRTLEIDPEIDRISLEYFQTRGKIDTLQTLVVRVSTGMPSLRNDPSAFMKIYNQMSKDSTHGSKFDGTMSFLRENNHISALCFDFQIGRGFLEYRLLPMLIERFARLHSLSLVIEPTHGEISTTTLEMIARLETLEQLQLTMGSLLTHGARAVHYNGIRKTLSPLKRLKRFALFRDNDDRNRNNAAVDSIGYAPMHYCPETLEDTSEDELAHKPFKSRKRRRSGSVQIEGSTSTAAAEQQPAHASDLEETHDMVFNKYNLFAEDHRQWELNHRRKMLSQGDAFFGTFPELEWLYIGQTSMQRDPITKKARVDCPV